MREMYGIVWPAPGFVMYRLMFRILIVVSCLLAQNLGAQALFRWNSEEADVTQYRRIEECFSAIERVQWRNIYAALDTFQYSPGDTVNSLRPETTKTALDCTKWFVENFSETSKQVNALNLRMFLRSLLAANRDPSAEFLVEEAYKIAADSSDSLRIALLGVATLDFLGAKPVRFAQAWRMYDKLLKDFPSTDTASKEYVAKQKVLRAIEGEAVRLSDTLNLAKVRGLIKSGRDAWLAQYDTKSRLWQERMGHEAFTGLYEEREKEALDSLRVSADAYQAFKHGIAAELKLEKTPFPDSLAPKLLGKFWFPSSVQRDKPESGKVSLVWFTAQDGGGFSKGKAIVKRLADKYPQLDVTAVMRTRGYVSYIAEPLPPQREAQIYDSLITKIVKIRATVVVEETPFWRLADPDRRRIDQDVENRRSYGLSPYTDLVVLLDAQGTKIRAIKSIEIGAEKKMERWIEALLQQAGHTIGKAASTNTPQ